jgi:hypothetical protein
MLDYSNRVIPRREPELIAREAQRLYGGCADKVATTSIRGMVVWGVERAGVEKVPLQHGVMLS